MSLRSCLTFRTSVITEDSARKPPIVLWTNYGKAVQQSDNLYALSTAQGSLYTTDIQVLPHVNIMFEFFVKDISVNTDGAIFSFEQAVPKDREDIRVIIHPYQGKYFAVNNTAPTTQISLEGEHHVLISIKQNLTAGSIKYFAGLEERYGSSYVFVFIDGKLIYTDVSQAPLGSSLVSIPEIDEPVRYLLGFSVKTIQETKTITGRKNKEISYTVRKYDNSNRGSSAIFREFRYYYDTIHSPLKIIDESFTPPTLLERQSETIYKTGDTIRIQPLIDLTKKIRTAEDLSSPLLTVKYPTLTKDTKINKDSFTNIAAAINSLEKEFSNNCCESSHCQTCQTIGYFCQVQCKQCSNCHQCKDCTKISWVYKEES